MIPILEKESGRYFIVIIILFIFSCGDAAYYIRLNNQSTDTIKVMLYNRNNKDKDTLFYSLSPNEKVNVGVAVNSIKLNDLSFNCIKVFTKNDTINECGKDRILNMFEKQKNGKLKKPYEIIIR